MHTHIRMLPAVLCALSLAAGVTRADDPDEIYYCEDATGNVVIQTDPCPKPTPAPVPVPAPAAPAAEPDPAATRESVSPKPAAAKPSPLTPAPVATLRTRTSTWTLVPRTDTPRPRRKLGKQRFTTTATAPTTVAFKTPERTWQTFLSAIENDDRAGVAACFTPSALSVLDSSDEPFALDPLRSMVQSFSRIENGGDVGPYWAIHGIRAGRRPKWIFFEETHPGEWKISGF